MRTVTAAQMKRIDRIASDQYGIPSLILMENAGAACVREIRKRWKSRLKKVPIFCGGGNNGGDGFVVARHLLNQGLIPQVFFFQKPQAMKPDPAINFNILKKIGVNVVDCSKTVPWGSLSRGLTSSDLVVDAIFGTGLAREVQEPFSKVISLINSSKRPVLSVDIPSGLNADSGEAMGIAVRADLTVALGLPKKGFYKGQGRYCTGRVVVVDISLPRSLLK